MDSKFYTVQSYSDILDTNILIIIINADVGTLFITSKIIQKYISELISTVFCRDDELYALSILMRARLFPYGIINELPYIYHQHILQPQNIVYWESELSNYILLIL